MLCFVNQMSSFVFIFLAILFKDAASDISDRGYEENVLSRLDEPYGSLEDPFSYSGDELMRPVENALWRGPGSIGQVAGIAVDPTGKPVIFHRGNHVWSYDSFNENFEYQETYLGPIMENTVLILDPMSGEVIHGWGNQTFFLPHGIHIDNSGNVWLTDVALHQVFKYTPTGELRLTLGQRFQPGNDLAHFCQPAAVATTSTGDIVVADGYCNSRIAIFTPEGTPKHSIGEPCLYLNIPHAVTILPNDEICVADRENARVVCLNVHLSGPKGRAHPPYWIRHWQLGRIFGIASYDGIIYGVTQAASRRMNPQGFTANPESQSIVDFWSPESGSFTRPHAIATCPNGTALYVAEIGPNKVWKFDLLRIVRMNVKS